MKTESELRELAKKSVQVIPALLGLNEYRCTDGTEYYDRKAAEAHQTGIERARNQ